MLRLSVAAISCYSPGSPVPEREITSRWLASFLEEQCGHQVLWRSAVEAGYKHPLSLAHMAGKEVLRWATSITSQELTPGGVEPGPVENIAKKPILKMSNTFYINEHVQLEVIVGGKGGRHRREGEQE